jgi:multiple sugar transport system substrate-binding protein
MRDAVGITGTDFTMEEFIAAAEARGEYSWNVSGVGDWDMYPLFWLFGGVLTDEGFTRATGYMDSAQSVQAVQKLLELHEKKILTIRDVDGSVDAWDGINSSYAMFFEGPWFFGNYQEKADAGIVAATIPTYNGNSASVVGGENIVVFAGSQNQDAAYEFAKFMTTEEVQLIMLKTGQIPILKSLVNHTDITSNPVWSICMNQLLEGASARIPSATPSEVNDEWEAAINNIFRDGADVQTELTNAATQIDSLLQ